MLQTTLYEFNWDQLLNLLPVCDNTQHESLLTPKDYNDPKFHWVLRNIDFKQWSLDEGPCVLCLTGHPSEGNLNQLSSYIVDREKAAGYSILPIFCSAMERSTTIATVLHIFLRKLVSCSPETRRTPIIRSFFSKLLEVPIIRVNGHWEEEELNEEVFLKYMKTILESAATDDLLISLKTAFDCEREQRVLVVINSLDITEPVAEPVGCVLALIKHLRQRKSNTKILLTSLARSTTINPFQDFLDIEYNKERKG